LCRSRTRVDDPSVTGARRGCEERPGILIESIRQSPADDKAIAIRSSPVIDDGREATLRSNAHWLAFMTATTYGRSGTGEHTRKGLMALVVDKFSGDVAGASVAGHLRGEAKGCSTAAFQSPFPTAAREGHAAPGALTVHAPFATVIHHERACRAQFRGVFDLTYCNAAGRSLFTSGAPYFNPLPSRRADADRQDDEPTQRITPGC
jgi:hypothetical protein